MTFLHHLSLLLLLSCGRGSEQAAKTRGGRTDTGLRAAEPAPARTSPGVPAPRTTGPALDELAGRGGEDESLVASLEEAAPDGGPGQAGADEDERAEAAPRRAWFPETMLFEPAVVTDDQGIATVPVRVPDRLTTWRILALAHDRAGHLAGDTTSFLGTLPVYVEPVVPASLLAGDRLQLPVQVVNTTARPWSGTVTVDITGAATGSFRGTARVPAGRSAVVTVPVSAPRAGQLQLAVGLGDADAVRRTIEVRPRGMPRVQARSGSLAGPRSFELVGPADMDADSARLRVVVNPGALALLRRELDRAGGGSGLAADAYALLLAGTAPALLEGLGETLEDARRDELRTLGLTASQRVMRHARAPDFLTAALLLPAAAAHPDNPVLARLADRLARQLAAEQRPDGTFGGGSGWTVQRMLVATAEATAAVAAVASAGDAAALAPPASGRASTRALAQRVRLAASAAFERHAGRIRDPYTAAMVLHSGAVVGQQAEALRALIRGSVRTTPDGDRILPVPEGVLTATRQRPTQTECTALAALALAGSPPASSAGGPASPDSPDSTDSLVADLATSLLSSWDPDHGWGDGRSNLWGTRAVASLLRQPLPEEIVVSVLRDGEELRRGVLTGRRRKELLVLEAPASGARGLHRWTVRADPAVAGLGFTFRLETRVPWPPPRDDLGLEAQVTLPDRLQVGHRATVEVTIGAPERQALNLTQPLPAGVQVDERSLDALVDQGLLRSWQAQDGAVLLELLPQDATVVRLAFDLVPTLAGTLHAEATRLTLADRPAISLAVPGAAWRIRGT